MIQKSFVSCATSCVTDGSQDNDITCFKEVQLCNEGLTMLKDQFVYMNSEGDNPDENDITENDITERVVG